MKVFFIFITISVFHKATTARNCIVPHIHHGFITRNQNVVEFFQMMPPGSEIEIHCISGSLDHGASEAFCRENGEWLKISDSTITQKFGICEEKHDEVDCGISSVPQGKEDSHWKLSKIGEFPWMATIDVYTSDSAFPSLCTGTLVAKDWLLTSAHCVDETAIGEISSLIIHTGRVNYLVPHEYTEQLRTAHIGQVVKHPKHNMTHSDFDFALIHIDPPVHLNQFVNTICLPRGPSNICTSGVSQYHGDVGVSINNFAHFVDGCSVAMTAGFGMNNQGDQGLLLKKASQTIYGPELCSARPSVRKFCAGSDTGGVDNRYSSSGSPLMCVADGRFYLTGVANDENYHNRDPTSPINYSRVCGVLPWLSRTISNVITPKHLTQHQSTKCAVPSAIEHGYVKKGSRLPGSVRAIGCSPGYKLVGSSFIFCLKNGAWTRAGFCEQIEGEPDSMFRTRTIEPTTTLACPEAMCPDGQCIGYRSICDGIVDCPDVTDEEGCLESAKQLKPSFSMD